MANFTQRRSPPKAFWQVPPPPPFALRNSRNFLVLTNEKNGEFRHLTNAIADLGGRCTDQVGPAVTHCVLGSSMPMSSKVLGCLVAQKPVLLPEYVYASQRAGRFLENEEDFLPEITRNWREYARYFPGGKPFSNWTFSVIVSNLEKRLELEAILRDGGATVVPHTPKSLTTTSVHELRNLHVILTEPCYLQDDNFASFLNTNRRSNWNILVYSHFYLIHLAKDPRAEQRKRLEFFQIENPDLITKLHKPKPVRG